MCVVSGGDLQCVELPGVYCPDKNYKDSNLTVYDWLHFRRE